MLAAEISPSPTYSAARGAADERGLALRFPRFVRARDDKRVRDATVAAQIASAYAQQRAVIAPGGVAAEADGREAEDEAEADLALPATSHSGAVAR